MAGRSGRGGPGSGGHHGGGGGGGGRTPHHAGGAPGGQPERIEIVRLWAERDVANPGIFQVKALVQVSQGRRALVRPVVLLVNGIARRDAGALADTDALDGKVILTATVDPVIDGDTVEIGVGIQSTTISAPPERLTLVGPPALTGTSEPIKTVEARTSGGPKARHKVRVFTLDASGNATSGQVTATYQLKDVTGTRADVHDVPATGLTIEYALATGETAEVVYSAPGATSATVTLKGEDKVVTKTLQRVDVNQTGRSFNEATGHANVLVTPRGFDEDGKGVAFELMLTFERPINVVRIEGGTETELAAATLQVVILIDAKPKATYRLVNPHEELIETDIAAVGIHIEINNLQLPAARKVAGEWRRGMSRKDTADYYRRGGM